MLAILLLIFGMTARFMFHIPNFTPVIVLALFSGVYLKKKYALLLPVALMAVTDIFIGLHRTMFFTWGSLVLIAAIGLWVGKHKSIKTIATTSLASAILFFLVTNAGVWLVSGLYPRTLAGLSQCFLLAIPFFRMMLLSTFVYSVVMFGLYEFIALRIKNTSLARVLLTA